MLWVQGRSLGRVKNITMNFLARHVGLNSSVNFLVRHVYAAICKQNNIIKYSLKVKGKRSFIKHRLDKGWKFCVKVAADSIYIW